jgi:hypothetical protein
VAIVERGVTRRGASATLVTSVLAVIAITAPASHVDASPDAKGSTMHKLAIAATVAATLTAGGIVVIATTARSGDARASAPADPNAQAPGARDTGTKHGHGRASSAIAGAQPGSLQALFAAKPRAHATATATARVVGDCNAVGQHLADLEGETGHDSKEPARCASDYAALCNAESWSVGRRSCALAADDLLNAHLCAFETLTTSADEVVPPELACATIAAHMTPIVQSAGLYADVSDFAQQVESACDAGNWSVALRHCFASGQSVDDLHGCIQPVK